MRDEIGAPAVVDRGVFQAEPDGHHEPERRQPRRPSLERRDDIIRYWRILSSSRARSRSLGAGIEGDDAIAQRREPPCRLALATTDVEDRVFGPQPDDRNDFVAERGGITRP